MSTLLRHTRTTLALTLAVGALSACVVAPYPNSGVVYEQPGTLNQGYYSTQPAPYPEVIPVAPYNGAIWIGGSWGWNGSQRHWNPGRWDAPRNQPRPGYFGYPDNRPVPHGQFQEPDRRMYQAPVQPVQPDRGSGNRDRFGAPEPRAVQPASPPNQRELALKEQARREQSSEQQVREKNRRQPSDRDKDGNPGDGRDGRSGR